MSKRTTFHTATNGRHAFIRVLMGGEWLDFALDCHRKSFADLLTDRIDEVMSKTVQQIRKHAYDAGKRAARGGPKVDEFSECVNDLSVGLGPDGWVE